MTTSGSIEGEQPISEQDVAGFTQKMEQWSATLPPAEQALLSLILSRAHSTIEDADVQGYSGLSANLTKAWLSPWALNQTLTYKGVLGADDAFAKDPGPSWVNSPRASLGSIGEQGMR